MIERKFISQNIKEFQIQEYLRAHLPRVGHSYTKLVRTPLGEKIVICASRPGLVVGKDGSTISRITRELKEHFKLENPQIELIEVESPHLDANIVAEMIANSLEQFGIARFKGVAHKALANVMNAGAIGIEINIGGKVPSARAKSWRFSQGYIKKCGDVAIVGVQHAYARAALKSGIVGIQVRIMPPTTRLPDDITIKKPDESANQPHVRAAGAPAHEPAEAQDANATSAQQPVAQGSAAEEKPKAARKPRAKKASAPTDAADAPAKPAKARAKKAAPSKSEDGGDAS